jgi:tripartite-type tricarboxylate transporter receptor subunit TctC
MSQGSRLLSLAAMVISVFGLLADVPARGQGGYPSQSIKFIVPYAAGGLPDTVARIIAQKLTDRLGHAVVVENRAGANGSIAAAALASAGADGYTFMVTDGSMLSVNPLLFKDLNYDPKKDFVPVALLARAPLFLASHPSLPVKDLKGFIDYVKANPGKLNYGSSGVGSTHHLSMEAMKAALKLDMAHVPYRGTGQSVPALLGGHVQVLFSAYPSLAGAVEGKTLNLLATNGAKRSPQAPDAPPIADVIPGFDFSVMVGILARAGTPPAIVEKIASEAVAAARMDDVAKQYAAAGIEQTSAGPAEFADEIAKEMERVSIVVRSANIKVQ